MRQCLTNPTAGYYSKTVDPFGKDGDFITAPEVSQMFGELAGVWFLTEWLRNRSDDKVKLIELGPGRGTLMRDLLLGIRAFPEFQQRIEGVHMVESSPTLQEAQRRLLCREQDNKSKFGNFDVTWSDRLDTQSQPHTTSYYVAHEFFDAMPIHKFDKTEAGWREVLVDVQPESLGFRFVRAPDETVFSTMLSSLSPRYDVLPISSSVEVSLDSLGILDSIALSIASQKSGAALIVDYGSDTIPINTLRGIRKHEFVSPLESPGDVDLSVDVDFTGFKERVEGKVGVWGPASQGNWLGSMGIGTRAAMLAKKNPDSMERIRKAYQRLTGTSYGEMGSVYKVMGITPKRDEPPAAF